MIKADVVVIGLGAVGSAALYQLSKSGTKVVGIDQHDPPHKLGSSHSGTRVTRQAAGEGSVFVPFVLRSHAIWKELEELTGDKILQQVGCLILAEDGDTNHHGKKNFLTATARNADQNNIPYEQFTTSELKNSYPQFNITGKEQGLLEPTSGYANPEQAIRTQLKLAEINEAQTYRNETVKHVDMESVTPKIYTDQRTFEADKVVISAGPWVNQFLPKQQQVFSVVRQVLYWFDISSNYRLLKESPTFVWMFGEGTLDYMYGFPAIDGPAGGLKVAAEQFHTTTTMDTINRTVSDKEKSEMFSNYILNRLPNLSSNVVRSEVCMYTTTADHNFVIDRHPKNNNVLVASPCSGHGFKHSAAIGELLAQQALTETSDIDSTFEL